MQGDKSGYTVSTAAIKVTVYVDCNGNEYKETQFLKVVTHQAANGVLNIRDQVRNTYYGFERVNPEPEDFVECLPPRGLG